MLTRETLLTLMSGALDAKPELVAGGARLAHVPGGGALNYLLTLYPPLKTADIVALELEAGRPVPLAFRSFLTSVGNGLSLYHVISIFGFVRELRRSTTDPIGQPISLRYGNVVERPRGLDEDDFGIGAMVGWSSRGTLVMSKDGAVRLVHPVLGEDVVAQWPDLDTMLKDEIGRLAPLHDRSGRRLATHTDLMHPAGRKWETKSEPTQH